LEEQEKARESEEEQIVFQKNVKACKKLKYEKILINEKHKNH